MKSEILLNRSNIYLNLLFLQKKNASSRSISFNLILMNLIIFLYIELLKSLLASEGNFKQTVWSKIVSKAICVRHKKVFRVPFARKS